MGCGAHWTPDDAAHLERGELLEDLNLVVGVEREEANVDAGRAAEKCADGPDSHV